MSSEQINKWAAELVAARARPRGLFGQTDLPESWWDEPGKHLDALYEAVKKMEAEREGEQMECDWCEETKSWKQFVRPIWMPRESDCCSDCYRGKVLGTDLERKWQRLYKRSGK